MYVYEYFPKWGGGVAMEHMQKMIEQLKMYDKSMMSWSLIEITIVMTLFMFTYLNFLRDWMLNPFLSGSTLWKETTDQILYLERL